MSDAFEQLVIEEATESMTPRQIYILRKMRAGKELVMERGSAYIGYERTHPRSVMALLRYCAIRLEDGSKLGQFERYTINGTGQEILKRLEGK